MIKAEVIQLFFTDKIHEVGEVVELSKTEFDCFVSQGLVKEAEVKKASKKSTK